MARKGSQQKNGVDRQASSHKKKGSESGSAVPDKTRRGRDSKVKVFPGEELSNGNHPGSPISENVKESHLESKKKNSSIEIEKLGTDARQDIEQTVSSSGNSVDHVENILTEEMPGVEKGDTGLDQNHGKGGLGCLRNGLHFQNVKNLDNLLFRSLKAHLASILKGATKLLDKQGPLFTTLTANIYKARDYGRMKIEQFYPVILNFLGRFVNIMLLLSMIWLDCALRGIDSFLRMGTASFFSVIWCSIFSVIGMAGMFKFLMVLVRLVISHLLIS